MRFVYILFIYYVIQETKCIINKQSIRSFHNYGFVLYVDKKIQLPFEKILTTFSQPIPLISDDVFENKFPDIQCDTAALKLMNCEGYNSGIKNARDDLIQEIHDFNKKIETALKGIPNRDLPENQVTEEEFRQQADLHISDLPSGMKKKKKRRKKNVQPYSQYNYVYLYNVHNRQKRGANWFGRVISTLTGQPDWDTVKTQNEHVKELSKLEEDATTKIVDIQKDFQLAIHQQNAEIEEVETGMDALHDEMISLQNNFQTVANAEADALHQLETQQNLTYMSVMLTEHQSTTLNLMSRYGAQLRHYQQTFLDGMITLKQGKLTDGILDYNTIKLAIDGIKQKSGISNSGMKLSSEEPAMMYGDRFTASSYSANNKQLYITLPFYLQPSDSLMTVYRVKKTPVQEATNQRYALTLTNVPDFFAVSEEETHYIELSTADLTTCNTETHSSTGASPVCDSLPISRSFDQDVMTCAAAIYKEQKERILSECVLSRQENSNVHGSVIKISPVDYLIFDPTVPLYPNGHKWQFECLGSNIHPQQVDPEVITIVQVPAGCSLKNGTKQIIYTQLTTSNTAKVTAYPELTKRYPLPLHTMLTRYNLDELVHTNGESVSIQPFNVNIQNMTLIEMQWNNSMELRREEDVSFHATMKRSQESLIAFKDDTTAAFHNINNEVQKRLESIKKNIKSIGDITQFASSVSDFFGRRTPQYISVLIVSGLFIAHYFLPSPDD